MATSLKDYKYLAVDQLKITPTMQRDIDYARVEEIAANWDDSLANPVEVTRATSGNHGYLVHNGQHTTLAARMVGKEFLLCRVFALKTREEMADRVIAVNTSQKPFTPLDKFKVISSNKANSDEASIRRIIEANGMEIGRGNGPGIIRSTQALKDAYSRTGEDFTFVAAAIAELGDAGIKVGSPDIFAISTVVKRYGAEAAQEIVSNIDEYPMIRASAIRQCIGVTLASSPSHLVKALEDHLDL